MARYALVIGISEYQSSNLSRLPKTVTDAEAVVQILKQYGDFQIVKRLPERWNQQQNDYEIGTKAVTGNELGQALRTFLLDQAYRSDALIYFSGHGITVSDNLGQTKGYLATSDCVLETDGKRIVGQQHGIDLDSLNELIRAAELSSLVLLLDCCHGGYFLERQLVEQTLTAFSSQKDYYVITACRTFEQAWAMHDEKHDVFTGAVLNGLALENAAKDGSVSGDRLFDRISTQLKGKRQEPIRMGWGKSITIVNYPLSENTPSTTFTFNRENPYQGLQAFELGKEKYFFGRELAIRALLQRLNNARFLSVIGRSGCGKSSLVKAGLLPALQSDRLPGSSQWEIEIFTPGIDPLGKLTEILGRRHQENKPFVLFIDQFEEVFTLCNDEAKRRSFMRLMADEATASDRITRVIVAIRGDFLDRCAAYPEAVNLINRTQPTTYVVELLSRSEIVETIEKPAELHGVGFEPGLVSQIAEDVENQPGALPLLQYALSELWRKFCEQGSPSGQPLLAWKDYEEIGGVKGALDNRATILYRSFIPEDQAFVRRLFIKLVKLGDGNEVTRRRATWDEVKAIPDSPKQLQQLQQVVRRLADQQQRLIITDENTIEVAHEALLSEWKLLRSWIEDNRENIRLKQSLEEDCREWLERFQKSDDALLAGARLAAIEEWVNNTRQKLPHLEAEFLHKSLERRDRELQEKIDAAKREAEAEARAEAEKAKAAEAEAKAETAKAKAAEAIALADIEKSLAAKREAEAEAREAEAKTKVQKQRTRFAIAGGILAAFTLGFGLLAQQRELQLKQREADVQKEKAINIGTLIAESKQSFNKGEQLEALISSVKALKALEELGDNKFKYIKEIQNVIFQVQERNRLRRHDAIVKSFSFSPDGRTIVSGTNDGKLHLWTIDGLWKKTINTGNSVYSVTFSLDGQTIVSAGKDKFITLWTKNGDRVKKFPEKHKELIWNVASSVDGTIASASKDGTIILWSSQGLFLRKIEVGTSVYDVSFSPDGKTIASAGKDGNAKLWTTKDGGLLATIPVRAGSIYDVSFSLNGQIIAFATKNATVKLWKKQGSSWKNIFYWKELKGHKAAVYSVNFSRDGMIISGGSSDESVELWNQKGTNIKTFNCHSFVNDVKFSPDGQTIGCANDNKSLILWNVNPKLNQTLSITELINYSCKSLQEYYATNPDSKRIEICPSVIK
jgi:WD40 repeat protein